MTLPEAARVAVAQAIERKAEDLDSALSRTRERRAHVQRAQSALEVAQRDFDFAERSEKEIRTALAELQTAIRS